MGAFMSEDVGSMGGGIPSNNTHVKDDDNGGETPKEDGSNGGNEGNEGRVVIEP
jgi:hypothetical protein